MFGVWYQHEKKCTVWSKHILNMLYCSKFISFLSVYYAGNGIHLGPDQIRSYYFTVFQHKVSKESIGLKVKYKKAHVLVKKKTFFNWVVCHSLKHIKIIFTFKLSFKKIEPYIIHRLFKMFYFNIKCKIITNCWIFQREIIWKDYQFWTETPKFKILTNPSKTGFDRLVILLFPHLVARLKLSA